MYHYVHSAFSALVSYYLPRSPAFYENSSDIFLCKEGPVRISGLLFWGFCLKILTVKKKCIKLTALKTIINSKNYIYAGYD